jgi:CRISPR-associated protein Cas2
MHVIVSYDVEANRTQLFKKICHKFLPRIQNSVFEGDLRNSQINELIYALDKEVKPNETVRIWRFKEREIFKVYLLGKTNESPENIL